MGQEKYAKVAEEYVARFERDEKPSRLIVITSGDLELFVRALREALGAAEDEGLKGEVRTVQLQEGSSLGFVLVEGEYLVLHGEGTRQLNGDKLYGIDFDRL